jgi:hypothetical protein
MIAVDSTYYLTTYLGVDPITTGVLARILARASDDIKLACPGGIPDEALSGADVSDLVRRAVCAQAEFYVLNGDTYNRDETAGQEQIGSFSKSVGLTQRRPAGSLAPRALMFLEQTGLMFRGVELL